MPKKKNKKVSTVVVMKKKQSKPRKQRKQQPKTRSRSGFVRMAEGPTLGSLLQQVAKTGLSMAAKSIIGFGDYKVSSNTVAGSGSIPTFGDDSIRVRRKEYLGDIISSVLYQTAVYPINPGVSTTFPWLSVLAQNFEEYEIHGLVFSFISTSAVALSTSDPALGKVMMATEYNVDAQPFDSARAMMTTLFSNYGKPSDSLDHAIECKRSAGITRNLLVRSGPVPPAAAKQLYDLGNFQISTEGMQTASNIGGLWVTYDVTFRKPILSVDSFLSPVDQFNLDTVPTVPDSLASSIRDLNVGGVVSYDVKNKRFTYTFPENLTGNQYEVKFIYTNTSSSNVPTGVITIYNIHPVGCVFANVYQSQSSSQISGDGTPLDQMILSTFVNITAAGTAQAQFYWDVGSIPVAYDNMELWVTQYGKINTIVRIPFFEGDLPLTSTARTRIDIRGEKDSKSSQLPSSRTVATPTEFVEVE